MGPVVAIKTGLAKSFQFKGRASRAEFWWFAAFNGLISFTILTTFADAIKLNPEVLVVMVLASVLLLPSWSACVRRLQDTGRSGKVLCVAALFLIVGVIFFVGLRICGNSVSCSSSAVGSILGITLLFGPAFVLFILVPFACIAVALIEAAAPSEPGANRFGPNPHEVPQ